MAPLEEWCGVGAAVTIIVAAFSLPEDRRPALISATMILAGWALYNSPWHGWGLHVWSKSLATYWGCSALKMRNSVAWSLQDFTAAAITMALWWKYEREWLLLLWAIYIGQLATYVAYRVVGNAIWQPVEIALDSTFLLSCVIIWGIGGRGVGDRITRGFDRLRNVRHKVRAALARASRQ